MSSTKFQSVKSWLAQKHIKVIDSWLTDCVDYFLAENPNIPLQTLQNKVYEQWKLADLCEVGIPCLPEINILANFTCKQEPLEGCYVLQLQSVLDISVPAYNQLEQIYKIQRQNLEEDKQEKGSRMLKLVLTDGATSIDASELRPINCLKSTLKPGTKVLLKGPMKMSFNAVLLLKEGNISILGGEVDSVLGSNSLINTILKSIGLSPEDNPYKNMLVSIGSQTQSSKVIKPSVQPVARARADDVISEQIINDLTEAFFDEDDSFSTLQIIDPTTHGSLEKNILKPEYAIKYNNIALIYIKQLNDIRVNLINEMKFVLIMQIKEFLEKLCIRNGEWHNIVCVTDFLVQDNEAPQHSINVKLHSDVINHFTGYSKQDMLNLQNKIAQDPKIKEEIINHLKVIKECFENEIFIANVSVFPSNTNQLPVITKLEELKNEHAQIVESKQNFD